MQIKIKTLWLGMISLFTALFAFSASAATTLVQTTGSNDFLYPANTIWTATNYGLGLDYTGVKGQFDSFDLTLKTDNGCSIPAGDLNSILYFATSPTTYSTVFLQATNQTALTAFYQTIHFTMDSSNTTFAATDPSLYTAANLFAVQLHGFPDGLCSWSDGGMVSHIVMQGISGSTKASVENPSSGGYINFEPKFTLYNTSSSGFLDSALTAYAPYGFETLSDFAYFTFKLNFSPSSVDFGNYVVAVSYNNSDHSIDETDFGAPFIVDSTLSDLNVVIPKGHTLPPNTYFVTGNLYKVGDYTDSIAATSTFGITISGDGTTTFAPPPTGTSDFTATCSSDGSVLQDITAALCLTAKDLFVPSNATLSNFSNLKLNLQTSAPFSYFYEVYSDFTTLSPTSSTFSGLTLSTGSSTPINVSVDMFSPDTINRYTSPTTRAALRVLISASLYLAFAYTCFFTVTKLFKKS